jgi:hypothetical protein
MVSRVLYPRPEGAMPLTFAALQWPLPNAAADRWADRVCAAALKDAGILKTKETPHADA